MRKANLILELISLGMAVLFIWAFGFTNRTTFLLFSIIFLLWGVYFTINSLSDMLLHIEFRKLDLELAKAKRFKRIADLLLNEKDKKGTRRRT